MNEVIVKESMNIIKVLPMPNANIIWVGSEVLMLDHDSPICGKRVGRIDEFESFYDEEARESSIKKALSPCGTRAHLEAETREACTVMDLCTRWRHNLSHLHDQI